MDAAVALLEDHIIPWQYGGDHAPPPRRLREEPAKDPLLAAEGLLRRSTRAGPPGLGEGSQPTGAGSRAAVAAEFGRQGQQLLRWARKNRRLIDRRLEERLVSIGGVEHEVFLDDDTSRWIKMTMPGKGGKELHAREEGFGVRPTLVTEDALPSAYLHRLVLANRRLGDDFWLHGVIDHPAGPRLVVSQKHLRGAPASPADIARHFTTAGFAEVNAKTFYDATENLLVSDAHTANVFRTPEGVVPFDVCVQQPRGALLQAVKPAETLSFDDWDEEQPTLTF